MSLGWWRGEDGPIQIKYSSLSHNSKSDGLERSFDFLLYVKTDQKYRSKESDQGPRLQYPNFRDLL